MKGVRTCGIAAFTISGTSIVSIEGLVSGACGIPVVKDSCTIFTVV